MKLKKFLCRSFVVLSSEPGCQPLEQLNFKLPAIEEHAGMMS